MRYHVLTALLPLTSFATDLKLADLFINHMVFSAG